MRTAFCCLFKLEWMCSHVNDKIRMTPALCQHNSKTWTTSYFLPLHRKGFFWCPPKHLLKKWMPKYVIYRRQSSSFQESTANLDHICWLQQSQSRFTQHTHCSWTCVYLEKVKSPLEVMGAFLWNEAFLKLFLYFCWDQHTCEEVEVLKKM